MSEGFVVTAESHLDHTLPKGLFEWVQQRVKDSGLSGTFTVTWEIPEGIEPGRCALRGPLVGDAPIDEKAVVYRVRPGRKCASRVAPSMGFCTTRKVTVSCGPQGDLPCVLYTLYAGPAAPREPGDLTLTTLEQIAESRAFWAVHALTHYTNE